MIVGVGAVMGMLSSLMVYQYGQARIWFAMSRDGLLPKFFSEVHPKFKTPYKSNFLFMIFVSLFAGFVPASVVGEMVSIGTLFAFVLVCAGIWVLRVKNPDAPRTFKVPMVPLIPILGIATCLFMMVFLPGDTWIRLAAWMAIGVVIYFLYSRHHSVLRKGKM